MVSNPAVIVTTKWIRNGSPIVKRIGIRMNSTIRSKSSTVIRIIPNIASPNDRKFFTASVKPTLKSFKIPLGDGAAALVSAGFLSLSSGSG